MADTAIKVSIIGDASKLSGALKTAEGETKRFGDKVAGVGAGLTAGLTLPIVAGAAVAVKAAAEEEQQMDSLADTITKRIPAANDAMIKSNEEWVSSLQNSIGVADSDIRTMEQSFIAAGASVEDAQRMTALAYDTAAQTGKDATTVGAAFIKGMNGQVGALGKLGIETKDAAGETKSFTDIQDDLTEKMGGSAAANMDTAAGKAQLMQLRMADLAETFGSMLLPIVETVVEKVSKVVEWFQNLDPAAQKVVGIVIAVVAALGPFLLIVGKLVTLWPTMVLGMQKVGLAFKALQALFMANPWILLIAAVIALVIIIVKNWDKIVAFLKKTWDWIKQTSAAVWNWIKSTIKSIVEAISGFFAKWNLPKLIQENWEKIKAGARAVKDFLINTWNNIVAFFRGLPSKISSAVSGMWDGIKNAFRSAVNWIIRKWNNLSISIGGGKILGVSIPKITVSTPNIPLFHDGGVFHAQGGRREGLALLRDGETVLPPGRATSAAPVYITINAGLGADPNAISKAVVQALQRFERANGPIPIRTVA
jgi:hypothetical protein